MFKATLYPESDEKDVLYSVEGQWSSTFTLKDAKTNTEVQTYNTPDQPTTPLTTLPEADQDPLESHKAWRPVTNAIQTGNLEKTSAEKSKIEDRQRDLRTREHAEGRKWESRYFQPVAQAPVFEALKAKLRGCPELQDPGPIWRWDERKAAQVMEAAKTKKTGAAQAAPSELKNTTPQAEEARPADATPSDESSGTEAEKEEPAKRAPRTGKIEENGAVVRAGGRSELEKDNAEAVRVGMPYTSHIAQDVK